MQADRILVVGTTSDYVDLLRRRSPGRVLFVTDPGIRAGAAEPKPAEDEEVLSRLDDPARLRERVLAHCRTWGQRVVGVACYDCESLGPAALLAQAFSLPFPSPASVAACRSKLASKTLWHQAGVPAPRAVRAGNVEEAVSFHAHLGTDVVVKPIMGSGSELVFRCRDEQEVRRALAIIASSTPRSEPRDVVIEECVVGTEYSCDFFLDDAGIRILRTARKIPGPETFGTTLAYEVPSDWPVPDLAAQIERAARCLGLERTLGMVDFICRDGKALLLELTPRPGGDCLPPLLQHSGGLDMLTLALDVAAGKSHQLPATDRWRPRVGLRLLGTQEGTIARLDDTDLRRDIRVVESRLTRRPGHRVVLPPADYDAWVLGYAIFIPTSGSPIGPQCTELRNLLRVDVDTHAVAPAASGG